MLVVNMFLNFVNERGKRLCVENKRIGEGRILNMKFLPASGKRQFNAELLSLPIKNTF